MTDHYKALVIPVEGPVREIALPTSDGHEGLDLLQSIVNGSIEAVPLPDFITGSDRATAYVNEEGKFDPEAFKPNMRATDFMVPGIGLFAGDYIAGAFVLCGFDPNTGEHRDLPKGVADRARLIEREAA